MRERRCFLLVVCLSLFSKATGQSLVLGGGGISDDNYEFWDKVVDLAGGPGVARLGIVTAASADPLDSFVYYDGVFSGRGAAEVYWIPVHEGNTGANSDPAVVDNINRMTGFFFGGGDQARIINSFYNDPGRVESPALAAIRGVYGGGAVIGGTSAGEVSQVAAPMIMGGYSWEALVDGAFAYNDPNLPIYGLEYDPEGGIGMFDGFVLDSHFSQRGREGRLTRLVLDTSGSPIGTPYGIGVDEDTALVVAADNTAEVIGVAGVVIIDVTEVTVSSNGDYEELHKVLMHYLTAGDSVNLTSLAITFAPDKSDITGQETLNKAPTSTMVFDGETNPNKLPEFADCAVGLFDTVNEFSTFGVTYEKNPEYQVNFYKNDPRAAGYKSSSAVISYTYLSVDMVLA